VQFIVGGACTKSTQQLQTMFQGADMVPIINYHSMSPDIGDPKLFPNTLRTQMLTPNPVDAILRFMQYFDIYSFAVLTTSMF
jgi:hypothetical protein